MNNPGIINDRNEYDIVVSRLFAEIPEFPEWDPEIERDSRVPYLVFGSFARFIDSMISSNNEKMLDKAFDFLNKMADSNDPDIQNLLVTGVLEMFTDSPETFEYAMKRLNQAGKQYLEDIREFWQGK